MNTTGNTMLITGGTSGIGRALAESFHAKGNTVIITGRRQHLLTEVEEANPGLVGLKIDVSDPISVQELARIIQERFPKLNVLINNAG